MPPIKKIFTTLLILFISGWIFFFNAYYIPHPVGNLPDDTYYLLVKKGESLRDIASNLEDMGVISSKGEFIFLAKLLGRSSKLKTGRYAVKPDYSIATILENISRGKATPFNVTVLEGYTMAEMAALLKSVIGMDDREFKNIVTDPNLIDSLEIEAENLEGYLAPSTYNFFYEENPDKVVRKMVSHFFESLPDSFEIKANKLGLTFHEAVILASLIEEEAMLDQERPRIASVYLNRLRKRWRLQCDPTVIYAMGGLDRRLYRKDLEYDSPYNTYQNYGLPPGPITNPGVKSLEAAVNPAKEEYMFFVARGDGSHVFTKTHRDHINAKNSIKRARQNG